MTERTIKSEVRDLTSEDRDQLADRLNKDTNPEEVNEDGDGDGYADPLL